jgi:hypothetical protein
VGSIIEKRKGLTGVIGVQPQEDTLAIWRRHGLGCKLEEHS